MPETAAALSHQLQEAREALHQRPEHSRALVEAALTRATAQGWTELEAEALLLLAGHAFLTGSYHRARDLGEAAQALLLSIGGGSREGEGHNLLGNVALERGDYDEALHHYTAAASVYERQGDEALLGRVYNNIGLVAWRLADLDRADECFRRSLLLLRPLGQPRLQGNILNNLGLVWEGRGDLGKAEQLYQEAFNVLQEAGDLYYMANAVANLGDVREAQGDLKAALRLHRQALELRLQISHRRGEVGSRVALCRILLGSGQLEEASTQGELALSIAREVGLRKHEADALSLLSRVAEARGELRLALDLQRQYGQARESVAGEEMARRVGELQTRLETRQARMEAERRRRENLELTQAKAEAERASRAKSDFLAMMSHEIRTPLASLIGAASLLATSRLDEQQRRQINVILASGDSLLAVINDVLDFSKIESGHMELERVPFRLAEVLEHIVEMVQPSAREKGLQLRVEQSTSLPEAQLGDPTRFRQLVLNLMSNAIKFTHQGWVQLRALPAGPHRLLVEVQDTGIGIPAEVLPRLFQPFTQADTSTTRRFGGTGLGLAICRRIVDQMGGQIEVSSEPGRGSTFRLLLPLEPTEAPDPDIDAAEEAPLKHRVLLVEDDRQVREVVCDMLSALGAEVVTASSGPEALGRFAALRPQLVVLDVHMPGMDGYDVAAAIRANGSVEQPWILGLSGAAFTEHRERGLRAGMDGWLSKPVGLSQLQAALEPMRGLRPVQR
jgi:signal transduction histidine kinase/CheY-like chemotaxis protein